MQRRGRYTQIKFRRHTGNNSRVHGLARMIMHKAARRIQAVVRGYFARLHLAESLQDSLRALVDSNIKALRQEVTVIYLNTGFAAAEVKLT